MYMSLVWIMVAAALPFGKGQQENCDVFPKDLYVEVGSSVELVCQTSCFRNGKIFWTLNNKNISESLSKTLNSTHTVLSLSNVTLSSATVVCHNSDMVQILGGTTIRTYSKPENIKCVLHHKDGRDGTPNLFTCTWKHHMNSSKTINYSVLYANSSNLICESKVTNCTSDNWRTAGERLFMPEINIVVRAKTEAWEAFSDPHVFKILNIWKITPPKRTVITAFSDHLLVEWSPYVACRKCHCEVKYSTNSESNDKTPKYLRRPPSHFNATFKDMKSCVNYSVSVRCAADEAPWSEWSQEETVLTKLNKEHIGLRLWRNVAEQGENGKRKVHLMWKGIPSTCGKVFTYTVKQIAYKGNTTMGNFTHTLCASSPCDVDVDQHAHRLCLTVSINDSLLAEDSVYVPAVGETGLPRVHSIETTADEGVILVSWNVSGKPISGYVIDWTHDGNQYYWKESKFTNATLLGLLDRKPYNITVTPVFSDSTGHGIHATQICSSVRVPESITLKVEDIDDKSALVKWDTTSEFTCSDVVTYIIFYEAPGFQLNVRVDGKEGGVRLKDLKPNTQYNVRVEATGYGWSVISKTMLFTTNTFDSRLIKTYVVCGGLLVIFVLSIGLTCAIQWKKFTEKPVPNPSLSSVAKWLSQTTPLQTQLFFQPFSDHTANQVVTDETLRERGSPLTPVSNGYKIYNQKRAICEPSLSPTPQKETDERFSETSGTHLLSSPEGSMALSSSLGSPYRSQDSGEPLLPRMENPSKNDVDEKQEKTRCLYVSLDMFEQSDDG